jgi:hypothetical protein
MTEYFGWATLLIGKYTHMVEKNLWIPNPDNKTDKYPPQKNAFKELYQ